jgi:NAD(P)-dependent dehydrogenase (short-subunit alcohol dehydrogenase family)
LYQAAILPIYCAAKYSVIGLVRSIGAELKNENIRVNAILPGAVPTNIGLPPKLVKQGITPTLLDDKITKPEHMLAAIQELLDAKALGETVEVSAAKRYCRRSNIEITLQWN